MRLFLFFRYSTAILGIFFALPSFVQADEVEATWLRAVPGFQVTQYADDDLATNIYSLTADRQGRLVVAGPGFIKILIDDDQDGRADRAKLFSDRPRNGAMGLCFDDTDLLCIGDEGLLRFRDQNGDDRADGPPEVLIRLKTGGEHDSHAIRKGPDGWWYLVSGNYSGVDSRIITSTRSPIKEPSAGVIVRISPDFKIREIYADGLRNTYDFDFDQQGDLFVYDSDGERDVSLPWYRPTRVFRLHPGAHAGWITRSWKRPGWYFDMPTVAARLGRGSPTGVVCYQHWQFPPRYRNAMLVLDWTFGRILAVHKLSTKKQGQSYRSELFVSGKGTHGFAPTDICVGIDGAVYVSVGGRSTRGGVYRIRHTNAGGTPAVGDPKTLADCLELPQPGAAWSQNLSKSFTARLGRDRLESAIFDDNLSVQCRIRAVELVTSQYGAVGKQSLERISEIKQAAVMARLAWSTCLQPINQIESATLFQFLNHPDVAVRIAAIESLTGNQNLPSYLAEPVMKCLASDNPHLTKAAAELTRSARFDPLKYWQPPASKQPYAPPLAYFYGQQSRQLSVNKQALLNAITILKNPSEVKQHLTSLRLIQLALGDLGPGEGLPQVFESYHARHSPPDEMLDQIRTALVPLLASPNARIAEETIRCLAMCRLGKDETAKKMLDMVSEESRPALDIHILAALAHSGFAHSELRKKLAQTILGVQLKIDNLKLNQDRNWEPRFKEVVRKFVQQDPELSAEWVRQGISSRGHVFLFQWISPKQKTMAVDQLIKKLSLQDDFELDSALVRLLASTKYPAHWEMVRNAFELPNVKDTVLELLGQKPQEVDRGKFLSGLSSVQVKTVRISAQSLLKLTASEAASEQFALLNAIERISPDREGYEAREWLVRLLQRNMGRSFGFEFGTKGHQLQSNTLDQWSRFLTNKFPETANRLSHQKPDAADFTKKLSNVDWKSGDVVRGKKLYQKLSCEKCHGNRNRLGPDLAGITKRFSRRDLLRAITNPSYQVPSRYQTTLFEMNDGTFVSGIIIYDSVDGVLLRDSDNKTLRIESSNIVRRQKISRSIMPENLLSDVDSVKLADLFRYLESL